jgi:ABC-type antimicrobial peptide transport system ATPase subunit
VFKEFSNVFKLYAYKNRDRCDLSIRVNESLVMTYKLTHEEIKQFFDEYDIIDSSKDKYGVQLTSQAGQYWFVMLKRHFNAVRITVSNNGVDFNHRVDIDDWKNLIKSYDYQMSNPMEWDNK